MLGPAKGGASSSSPAAAAEAGQGTPPSKKPIVMLVIGMAGSGKTTLIQRLNSHLHTTKRAGYIINLDPAVTHMPYDANIDIRDTVKYKNVMKQYNLGPNGGILTSCNLFATRFDQVIQLCEKPRTPALEYIVVDTPGQIEIFTWSASGAIVTELFASSFPTVVLYVVDTPRCVNPQTFMSNMLQACSILYKTKLPMLLVFNKTDIAHHGFALNWMADFDSYSAALEADATYAATLSRSLSLVLDEFYTNLRSVGVSALTGAGMDDLMTAIGGAAEEYEEFYVPDLQQRKKAKEGKEQSRQAKEMEALRADMEGTSVKVGRGESGGGGGGHDGGSGGGGSSSSSSHGGTAAAGTGSGVGREQIGGVGAALGGTRVTTPGLRGVVGLGEASEAMQEGEDGFDDDQFGDA
ncbi:MAG: hypothetical protein WDW38_000097 [Sanguina aurantia]